jgi:hypothetical protein
MGFSLHDLALDEAIRRLRMTSSERNKAKALGFPMTEKTAEHVNGAIASGAVGIPGGAACWCSTLRTLFHKTPAQVLEEFEKIHETTKPRAAKTLVPGFHIVLRQGFAIVEEYYRLRTGYRLVVTPESFRAYCELMAFSETKPSRRQQFETIFGPTPDGSSVNFHEPYVVMKKVIWSKVVDLMWDKGSTPEVLNQAFAILEVQETHE